MTSSRKIGRQSSGRKAPAAKAAFRELARELRVAVADAQRRSRSISQEIKDLAEAKRKTKAVIAEKSRLAALLEGLSK
jgi:uncharacterized protein (DUF2342 family)